MNNKWICWFFHKWGTWRQYTESGIATGLFYKQPTPYTDKRQTRRCERCGKVEDEKIHF